MALRLILGLSLLTLLGLVTGRAYSLPMAGTQFPERGEVLKSFETKYKKPIDAFFSARDNNASLSACRASLAAAMNAYSAAELERDADEMARIMGGDGASSETPLMDLMQQCGPCVASVDNVSGAVYASDGWCRLDSATADVMKATVDKAKDFLINLKNYPSENGGFNYVLNFDGVTADGKAMDNAVVLPAPEVTTAWVAVRSLFQSAFGYFGDCMFKDSPDSDPVRSFMLTFARSTNTKLTAPKSIIDPETQKRVNVFAVGDVRGLWLIDSERNVHYFTKADFGKLGAIAGGLFDLKDYARRVLMDTMFHLYRLITPRPVAQEAK